MFVSGVSHVLFRFNINVSFSQAVPHETYFIRIITCHFSLSRFKQLNGTKGNQIVG
jgi:hypothetical protein